MTDPAVIGVAESTGLDEFAVVGRLIKLWCWANEQLRDGYAVGVTFDWVDRFVGYEQFATALQKYGWLKAEKDGLSIPNFSRHNGKAAKLRADSAERMRRNRLRKSYANNVTNVTNVTLLEKRREEKNIKEKEIRKEKEVAPKKRTGCATQMPADLSLTSERRTYAESKGVASHQVAADWEHFCDYHRARATRFADWDAAWRTWVRNAVKFSRRAGDGAPDAIKQAIERVWDEKDDWT